MGEMVKFLADRTTGKLARKLRALGFDVASLGGGELEEAARTAALEGRMLLTRSRRLSKPGKHREVLVLDADHPREQVQEVLEKLSLAPRPEERFSRCILCNEKLLALGKAEVEGRVPDFIYRTYDSFHVCPRCARVYWPGTHLVKMAKELVQPGVRKKNS